MKTILTSITGIALGALLFSVPMVGAANGDGTGPDGTGKRIENSERPCRGQGRGMHHGRRGHGQGAGFVDQDGDGVCDHYKGQGKMMSKDGSGLGKGRHNGKGPRFVDADGNGVCDHHPDNVKIEKSGK